MGTRQSIRAILLILIIGIIITGCHHYYYDLPTLRNPQYNDVKISKIMVFVPVKDIQVRETTEKWFVERFSKYGIKAVESYKIVSPLRSYSSKEMKDIFKRNQIDAYMIVNITASNGNTYIAHRLFVSDKASTTSNYLTDTKLFLVNVTDPIWQVQYTLKNYDPSDYDDLGYNLAWEIVGTYARDFKKSEHK